MKFVLHISPAVRKDAPKKARTDRYTLDSLDYENSRHQVAVGIGN